MALVVALAGSAQPDKSDSSKRMENSNAPATGTQMKGADRAAERQNPAASTNPSDVRKSDGKSTKAKPAK
jgi:hypothetical protein